MQAGCATRIYQPDRRLVADGPIRSDLVVVSAQRFQLFGRISKRQEPVGVQALSPEAAVEGFNEGVGRRLAGPAAVQGDPIGIGP